MCLADPCGEATHKMYISPDVYSHNQQQQHNDILVIKHINWLKNPYEVLITVINITATQSLHNDQKKYYTLRAVY